MKCRHCESENTVKSGLEMRARGMVQRYRCKECFKFTYDASERENEAIDILNEIEAIANSGRD